MKLTIIIVACLTFSAAAWSQTAADSNGNTPAGQTAPKIENSNDAGKKVWFYGRTDHPWWSNRAAGLVGGWGGGIIGCLGGLIGVLCGRGKGRDWVIALMKTQIGLGILFGVTGVVALAQHQPYAVWYPLLLGGFLLVTLYSFSLSTVGRRYQELELRRMQALDASG
jgi:hypothetical protein